MSWEDEGLRRPLFSDALLRALSTDSPIATATGYVEFDIAGRAGSWQADSFPLHPIFAERLTRLALVGSTPRPLERDHEQRHIDRWPTARWETAGDAAAVAFGRVLSAGGIRHVRPRSWWQWLFWRSSTEETRALAGWRQKHPDHPLAGVAETLAQ